MHGKNRLGGTAKQDGGYALAERCPIRPKCGSAGRWRGVALSGARPAWPAAVAPAGRWRKIYYSSIAKGPRLPCGGACGADGAGATLLHQPIPTSTHICAIGVNGENVHHGGGSGNGRLASGLPRRAAAGCARLRLPACLPACPSLVIPAPAGDPRAVCCQAGTGICQNVPIRIWLWNPRAVCCQRYRPVICAYRVGAMATRAGRHYCRWRRTASRLARIVPAAAGAAM